MAQRSQGLPLGQRRQQRQQAADLAHSAKGCCGRQHVFELLTIQGC
jgi:hypothetical protein